MRPPGLPRRLKLGPLTYRIQTQVDLQIAVKDAAYTTSFVHENEVIDLRGLHYSEELLLILNPVQAPSLFNQTLLHETLHAVIGQQPTLRDLIAHGEVEERIVAHLAPMLLAVIRDNPDFIRFLQRKAV